MIIFIILSTRLTIINNSNMCVIMVLDLVLKKKYIILLTLYEHCPGALRFVHKSFWGSCLVFSLGGIVLIARTDKETLVVTRHNNDK